MDKIYRGYRETVDTIKRKYCREDMVSDRNVFVLLCIKCIVFKKEKCNPRSIPNALHVEKPIEVVHFDFIYMVTAEKAG